MGLVSVALLASGCGESDRDRAIHDFEKRRAAEARLPQAPASGQEASSAGFALSVNDRTRIRLGLSKVEAERILPRKAADPEDTNEPPFSLLIRNMGGNLVTLRFQDGILATVTVAERLTEKEASLHRGRLEAENGPPEVAGSTIVWRKEKPSERLTCTFHPVSGGYEVVDSLVDVAAEDAYDLGELRQGSAPLPEAP